MNKHEFGNVPNSLPAGFKLVPLKPTDEMLDAALAVHESRDGEDEEFIAEFKRTYKAMIGAAPMRQALGEPDAVVTFTFNGEASLGIDT